MKTKDWQETKLRRKRLSLFSRYDEGIRLSDEMMYSVTVENIAHEIARKAYDRGFRYAVDGCGGCGGNTIAFAAEGLNAALVELNPSTLEDAKINAGIYEVDDAIQFFLQDILTFDPKTQAGFNPEETLFFSSPEWGGPSYKESKVFDLEHLNPPLSVMLDYVKSTGYAEAIIYVPRTSDIHQAEEMGAYKCEYMYTNGWCSAMCLYFKTRAATER